jgi:hypothetical protein
MSANFELRSLRLVAFALAAIVLGASLGPAAAQHLSRERDIQDLRLGQKVLVDDGTCPAGQIKEVTGATLTPSGVSRTSKCVPRLQRR